MTKPMDKRLQDALLNNINGKVHALSCCIDARDKMRNRAQGWDRSAVQDIINGFYRGSTEGFINHHLYMLLDQIDGGKDD